MSDIPDVGQSKTIMKHASSIVYDVMRSSLPLYERNQAWAKSKELQIEEERKIRER